MTSRVTDRGASLGAVPSFALRGPTLSPSVSGGTSDSALDAHAHDALSSTHDAPLIRSSRRLGLRIVVVDDEADIVEILAEALRSDGYVAETFTDPVRAFEHLLASPPALLVTDLYMPYLSGAELVSRVRATFSSLPIIVMSASANMHSLARVPAQAFLGKPFDLDEVSDLVAKLLHV